MAGVDHALRPVPLESLRLQPGLHQRRFELNRRYLDSLKPENLLRNHLFEAGLWGPPHKPGDDIHWGWESPSSQVRSHMVGHWLAASARTGVLTGDGILLAKVRHVVSELGRCQQANGGEWVAGIPEKYLHWIAAGRMIWAPHYVAQKPLMGLLAAHTLTGDEQALEIVVNASRWFSRWLGDMTPAQLDDLFDFETNGMLELWADLFAITGDERHLDLVNRYYRRRLFDPLLAGDDVLTNQHANMTIPEIQGAARAWEVTGEQRWRDIVEAYWQVAVVDRPAFCTGGRNCAELWAPPGGLSARLGDTDQEHCTVFNMNRLAAYLLRWTGDPAYADHRERAVWNGILAQQSPVDGMVTYYLPLRSGGRKTWSTPTESFWCCVATLVEANAAHVDDVYYEEDGGLVVAQYVGSEVDVPGVDGVTFRQRFMNEPPLDRADYSRTEPLHRPDAQVLDLQLTCERPTDLSIGFRLPWWLAGPPVLEIDGVRHELPNEPGTFHRIRRTWDTATMRLVLPKKVVAEPLPGAPDTFAFLDGPVVLAGLVESERTLVGDPADPTTMLRPDDERALEMTWKDGTYRTRGIDHGFRLVPLYTVVDEPYGVYFPVQSTT
jgi:DUF1680 family protein